MMRPGARRGAIQPTSRMPRSGTSPWLRYAKAPYILTLFGAETPSRILAGYGGVAALLGVAWLWSRFSTSSSFLVPQTRLIPGQVRLLPTDLSEASALDVSVLQRAHRGVWNPYFARGVPHKRAHGRDPKKRGQGWMRSSHHAPLHRTLSRLVRDTLHRLTVGTRLQERRIKATEVSDEQEVGRGRAFLVIYTTALGATALAFITLALLVRGNQLTQLDVALTRQVQAVHEPIYAWALTHASDLGWFPANAVCFGLIFLALFQLGLRLEAILAVASSLIAGVAGEGVKLWVGRMRPSAPAVHVAAHLSGYSFPSGHVIQYVTLFGFTSYVVAATWSRGVARNALLVLFAALIALVGPSRVYLGQHWPSDVVGAYLFSALWLAGTIELHLMLKRRGISLSRRRTAAEP
jgi:membrane-associated phospholipid phosphatase